MASRTMVKDPASSCSASAFIARHYALDWNVDFATRAIKGTCAVFVNRVAGVRACVMAVLWTSVDMLSWSAGGGI